VTLHNQGLAFARLAELDPSRAREHLEAGAKGLAEAVESVAGWASRRVSRHPAKYWKKSSSDSPGIEGTETSNL
jgi:hypothetical protein